MTDAGLRVALLSLEPWDEVWRRNQYLASHLVRSGAVSELLFLEPPRLGFRSAPARDAAPGIRALPLQLLLPKRVGGLAELGRRLRTGILRACDVLWVNDPALGAHCLRHGQPAVYDVTDDWRTYDFPPRIVRRIVASEDALAKRAQTIVCSLELKRRWRDRYGLDAAVVNNGVDGDTWRAAPTHRYGGKGPHVGYVGTLQPQRLDIDLALAVASNDGVGRLHLVGPDALDESSRNKLRAHPKVELHPPVPARAVPAWTKGLDVLISPHVVTPFTLSLDAIKSYEYLASGRPVVATPTSGFQLLGNHPSVYLAAGGDFLTAVRKAIEAPRTNVQIGDIDWAARAREFAKHLPPASILEQR